MGCNLVPLGTTQHCKLKDQERQGKTVHGGRCWCWIDSKMVCALMGCKQMLLPHDADLQVHVYVDDWLLVSSI